MATHGVLSGPAIDRLKNAPIGRVVITNTLPLPSEKQIDKIEVLSIAQIIADALDAVFEDTSVSARSSAARTRPDPRAGRRRSSRSVHCSAARTIALDAGGRHGRSHPTAEPAADRLAARPAASATRARSPGVVYGQGAEPVPSPSSAASCAPRSRHRAGLNALIDLKVDGDDAAHHREGPAARPDRRDVTHVDFLRVDRDEAIAVEVPIHLRARPTRSPRTTASSISRSITSRSSPSRATSRTSSRSTSPRSSIGDAIRVHDLALPAGVTTDGRPRDAASSPPRPPRPGEDEAPRAKRGRGRRGRRGRRRRRAAAEERRRRRGLTHRVPPRRVRAARARRPTCWSSASATPAPSTPARRHNVGAESSSCSPSATAARCKRSKERALVAEVDVGGQAGGAGLPADLHERLG